MFYYHRLPKSYRKVNEMVNNEFSSEICLVVVKTCVEHFTQKNYKKLIILMKNQPHTSTQKYIVNHAWIQLNLYVKVTNSNVISYVFKLRKWKQFQNIQKEKWAHKPTLLKWKPFFYNNLTASIHLKVTIFVKTGANFT